MDDYRFNGIYDRPERTLPRYSQYAFLLSPDYSTYSDMSLWRQLENVAKNRWVGAYWQSKGLTVIPTVSWGLAQSFDFCFDGIERKLYRSHRNDRLQAKQTPLYARLQRHA